MATNTFVDINLKEAAELADLTGVRFDLASARALALQLKNITNSDSNPVELIDAFTTAILVRYSRSFVTGVREKLKEDALSTLTMDQRHRHNRLRDFRDKHIAHSVNAFEESQPVARYWVERVNEEGIESIECNHTRIIGLSSSDIEDVIELSSVILSYVEKRLDEEKVKILELVRGLPVTDVISGERKSPKLPDIQRPDVKRKSF